MTNLTLRDRRHQQAQKDFGRLERQRDETLDKLARIAAKIKATRRSIERYERTPTLLPAPRPVAVAAPANVEPPATTPEPTPYRPGTSLAAKIDDAMHGGGDLDLEIPGFLKRAGQIGHKTPADIAALAEIEVEQANKRIAKSRARIDKMKAKQSGETKQMPLTGKAALQYLKTGKRA